MGAMVSLFTDNLVLFFDAAVLLSLLLGAWAIDVARRLA